MTRLLQRSSRLLPLCMLLAASAVDLQAQTAVAFAPGGQQLVLLDFSRFPLGRVPVSPSAGQCLPGIPVCDVKGELEVVMQNGVPMLRASARSSFVVTLPQRLPSDFTLEFDLISKTCCQPEDLSFEGTREITQSDFSANVLWHHNSHAIVGGATDNTFSKPMPGNLMVAVTGSLANIAVSVRGTTFTMYTNGEEVYTIPREFARGSVLRVFLGGQNDTDRAVYLARLRIGGGPPAAVATAPVTAILAPAPAAATAVPLPTAPAPAAITGSTSSLGPRPAGSPTVHAGTPPTGFSVSNSTPSSVSFVWNPAAGASDYTLLRTTGVGQPWVTVTQTAITGVAYTDANALDHKVGYTYRLQANYSATPPGYVDLNVSLPAPKDPTGFIGLATLPAGVHLSWQAVPGATSYLVNGPGLAGTTVNGTSFVVGTAPAGNNVYRVASVYDPGGVLTPAASWPTATVRVAPTPILPFLSLINGPGNTTLEGQHSSVGGICWDEGDAWASGCMGPAASGSYPADLKTIFDFWGQKTKTEALISLADVLSETISFSDIADLGSGRRVWCGSRAGGRLCIANSHGQAPDAAGANNAQQNADAAALNVASRSYTVISQRTPAFGGKFFFYQFTYPNGVDPTTAEPDPIKRFEAQLKNSFNTVNNVTVPSKLDSQGSKFAPHVCLSCHGGRFNSADNTVIDGSLLPIDPSRVVFSTLPGATRADQEKKIQAINRFVASSGTALVSEYINKMYGGNWTLPARDDIVPAGWSGQQNLWNTVVRPYCIMCHMAQLGPLAFSSFNDMVSVKDRVLKSVCTDGTMPHSEIAFRQFWTQKASVSLPDQLLTALGFKSCP